jgi:hypothetical protein
MGDPNTEILAVVSEIRDLIRLLAEPAIAERDKKLRSELRRIVGSSVPKQKAVSLMDGTRTQSQIHRDSLLNQGHLSTLVRLLGSGKLLSGDVKKPHLAIQIPPNFFEGVAPDE